MNYWHRFWVLGILALAITNLAAQSTPASKDDAKAASAKADQVVKITLPDYAGQVLKGPHVDVYERNCLICHSARYVIMQPPFSRSVWESEVKKMVNAYGATISEADQREIVEYLVAVRGTPENKPPASAH